MRLYIIYRIYLYMCIIIFIYVLFSDKRFPMPCHTLSIQVCRSTCFVKCKHARLKVQILQFAQNTLRRKKKKYWNLLSLKRKTQPHSNTYCTKSSVQVGCERRTFWTFTRVGPDVYCDRSHFEFTCSIDRSTGPTPVSLSQAHGQQDILTGSMLQCGRFCVVKVD